MTDFPNHLIRNFSIIAHIDHGKSTLADRFLLHTHTIDERTFHDQVLDAMDLEQERGITIKCHPVRMSFPADDGQTYQLNLIDTPGHVDFSYEVSRSLAACEGALLLVDASQGVQAQTVANANLAMRQKLTVIPVINKIDLPAADIETCLTQIEELLAIPREEALLASAKAGTGIHELLEAVVARVPPPTVSADDVLRALVFDSVFDVYRGVVAYVRLVSGSVRAGDKVRMFSTGLESEVKEVGIFCPEMRVDEGLSTGQVGYLITSIREPLDVHIGDTITLARHPCEEPLPGFQKVHPMVFSGIYPIDTRDYEALKFNITKLQLNDSAFVSQPESSVALGAGFRCGFLGLLHMEIVQERLRREYDMDIILTYPSVVYHVYMRDGSMRELHNPIHMPDPTLIDHIEEPMIKVQVMAPTSYVGALMNLIMEKRGVCQKTDTVDRLHIMMTARMPLHEIVLDFYDKLKTVTRGYGSMDYEPDGYVSAPLVKLELLVNGEGIDAFASIVHVDRAPFRARQLAKRLKDVIPPHLFKVAIQGAVGGKIVAREDVRQLRKDVTSKCYGGDISRKRKLLEKQKEGKARMKEIGSVQIPQEAFVAVLKATE
jgi:GTP-binding protein LepA